jgi:hypothetical protein
VGKCCVILLAWALYLAGAEGRLEATLFVAVFAELGDFNVSML